MFMNIPSLPFYQNACILDPAYKVSKRSKEPPEIKILPLVTDDYSFRKTKQNETNPEILYDHLFMKTPFDDLIIILVPICYGEAQLCPASVIDSPISPMCC